MEICLVVIVLVGYCLGLYIAWKLWGAKWLK